MDQDRLEQVKERFRRLRQASGIVVSNASLEERGSAWFNLLQQFGTIYSKLEQAGKGHLIRRNDFSVRKQSGSQMICYATYIMHEMLANTR